MAVYNIVINIPDVDAQDVFMALQKDHPINEGETTDAYIARVSNDVFLDLVKGYFMEKAQKEAIANIEYPAISVTLE